MVANKVKACGVITPGPGQYKRLPLTGCKGLDPTFKSSPCYSFGIRHHSLTGSTTPGPIYDIEYVTRNGKITVPQAPLTFRHGGVSAKGFIPAPGQYRPEQHMDAVFTRAPAYSIGRRFSRKGQFATPGPNFRPNYDSIKPSAPKYSLQGRTGGVPKFKTPAPNQYGVPNLDMVKYKGPAYSLASRRVSKNVLPTPGPGAYDPHMENVMPRSTSFKLNSQPNPCLRPYVLPADEEFNS